MKKSPLEAMRVAIHRAGKFLAPRLRDPLKRLQEHAAVNPYEALFNCCVRQVKRLKPEKTETGTDKTSGRK